MKLSAERNASFARRLIEHIKSDTTDMADGVVAFDPKIYSDPALAAREVERIFESAPVMVAHASELPETGDFVTVRMNSTSVLLTRKADGTLGAFLNACRHRGSILVDKERGKARRFTCKYHAWTYANDGTLKSISFDDSFGAEPGPELGLVALPVEERHGFVWVVEDPGGRIDVAAHLGPDMDRALGECGFSGYHFFRGEVLEFPQNWKIMLDGLLDGYHVKFLHGATISPYFYHNILAVEFMAEHALWASPRKRIDDIIDQEPGGAEMTRYAIFAAHISPITTLVMHPHHTEFWTIYQHPDGPEKCRAHLRFLTPRPIDTHERKEIIDKNYKILLDAVINEDVPAGNSVQASSSARHAAPLHLGRNEVLNQMFHRNWQRRMGS